MNPELLGQMLDLSSKMQDIQRRLARVIRDEAYDRGKRDGYDLRLTEEGAMAIMSFNIVKAGKLEDVKREVADASTYNNLVGVLAKRFIADVLELSGSTGVIVETSGHSGSEPGGHVSVKVEIRPVL